MVKHATARPWRHEWDPRCDLGKSGLPLKIKSDEFGLLVTQFTKMYN